jgi:AbrB family looped-hinge helix DNA binding protein
MDKKGRITIPKAIRAAYKIVGPMKLELSLMVDGTIELVPKLQFRRSFFMASDPELLRDIAEAYANQSAENFASDKEIEDLLSDD